MGSKNNPGVYDCYSKAEGDEPLFTLLGRDWRMPALVLLWAAIEPPGPKQREAIETAARAYHWGWTKGQSDKPPTVRLGRLMGAPAVYFWTQVRFAMRLFALLREDKERSSESADGGYDFHVKPSTAPDFLRWSTGYPPEEAPVTRFYEAKAPGPGVDTSADACEVKSKGVWLAASLADSEGRTWEELSQVEQGEIQEQIPGSVALHLYRWLKRGT